MSDFNLSDKRIDFYASKFPPQYYFKVEDVKEFIKQLKEGFKESLNINEGDKTFNNGWDCCVGCLFEKIDKLAGEKLI